MRLVSEKEEETKNMHRITQLKEQLNSHSSLKQLRVITQEEQALKNNGPP